MAEAQAGASGSDAKVDGDNAAAASATENADAKATSLLGSAEAGKDDKATTAAAAETKADDKAKPADPAKPAIAEIELKLPAGFDAKDEGVGKFKELVKGLDSKNAQALFDMHAEAIAKAREGAQHEVQQALKEFEATRAGWVSSIKSDPEVGGPNFTPSLGSAQRAIQYAGGAALRAALEESGYGDHPAFFKAFAKLGALIKEDGIQSDGEGGAAGKTKISNLQELGERLYGA